MSAQLLARAVSSRGSATPCSVLFSARNHSWARSSKTNYPSLQASRQKNFATDAKNPNPQGNAKPENPSGLPQHEPIPWGPDQPKKYTPPDDQLTIDQMSKDWEYLKAKTNIWQSEAEFLRLWETYHTRDVKADSESNMNFQASQFDRPQDPYVPGWDSFNSGSPSAPLPESFALDRGERRPTTRKDELTVEEGLGEAITNRVHATQKDWTAKSRPGADEIPEFFRKMDKNFEELKSIHKDSQLPPDLAQLDAEVRATRDQMKEWLKGKTEHVPVKSTPARLLRESLSALYELALMPFSAVASLIPRRFRKHGEYTASRMKKPVLTHEPFKPSWSFTPSEAARVSAVDELQRRVRHVAVLEHIGAQLSPDDELIRDTPREEQLQRILLGLPPLGALPFQSRTHYFVSQKTVEEQARKLLDLRAQTEAQAKELEEYHDAFKKAIGWPYKDIRNWYIWPDQDPVPAMRLLKKDNMLSEEELQELKRLDPWAPEEPPQLSPSGVAAAVKKREKEAAGAASAESAEAASTPPTPPPPPSTALVSTGPEPEEVFLEDVNYEPVQTAVLDISGTGPAIVDEHSLGRIPAGTVWDIYKEWLEIELLQSPRMPFHFFLMQRVGYGHRARAEEEIYMERYWNTWYNKLLKWEYWGLGSMHPARSKLFMRVIAMSKDFPVLRGHLHYFKPWFRSNYLLPFFNCLYQNDYEGIKKYATPSFIAKYCGVHLEGKEADPSGDRNFMWILNRSMVRRVSQLKINNISEWNGILLITILIRVRHRQWHQNMETGETIIGGPKSAYLSLFKLNVAGLPVPGKPGETQFKAVMLRAIRHSVASQRLRRRQRRFM